MMAEEAAQDDNEVFVYMGGNQQVPDEVRRARIHKSVKTVRARAFQYRRQLISVEFHDGVEIVEEYAFDGCYSLRGMIKLLGVKIIKVCAFQHCRSITDVEFGDKLETIEYAAFNSCKALRSIRIPSVRTIEKHAFVNCTDLFDVECGEGLRTLELRAFADCSNLKWITLPLKGDMIENRVFDGCVKLTIVDLVGGIHNTVASLHFESWRNEMNNEINRINQILPTFTAWHKTGAIQRWIGTVIGCLNRYKTEHKAILKEATALLELALWKANLDDYGEDRLERDGVRTTRGSRKRARKEICVTSGASIVIKNVLPFLQLVE